MSQVCQLWRDEWVLMNSGGDVMSAILPEQGIRTVHDRVVSEVAQRWAKAFRCKVTIRTSLEQNLWADPKQQSDIVGWYFSPQGNSMEWIAEVETEDTLSDSATRSRWQQIVVPGIPMYLIIPRGNKIIAEKLVAEAAVHVTGIYQYNFFNGVVQLL
jgi:hypothetical protein